MSTASVIVPTLGGASRLPGLLRALSLQQGDTPEVIVVCDGDIDGSAQIARSYADSLNLQVIAFAQNRGRPAALNAGFHAATGDVLIRCDDDLGVPSNFVASHLAHHQGEPVGVVELCEDTFDDVPYARVYGLAADRAVQLHQLTCPPERRWTLWSGNVSVTRDVFEHVGDYDESFREYGWEDVDWGYRLHQLGYPIVVTDDAKPLHFNSSATATARAERAFTAGRSRARFIAKHGDQIETPRLGNDPWNIAVRSVGRLAGPRSVPRIGAVVDRAIAHLPAPVAEKMVALLVEGSARAGHRHHRL